MCNSLKDILRKMHEYHLEEYAERLEEVGGPGVGGTELRYSPHFITQAETKEEMALIALQSSDNTLWGEATWCYVYGQFRACIVLCAILVERTLQLELKRRAITFGKGRTLGPCIEHCCAEGILSDEVAQWARLVNERRNDVIHAKIEMERPEGLLSYAGPEHETKIIEDPSQIVTPNGWLSGDGEVISIVPRRRPKYQRVFPYKFSAKETLNATLEILKSLYAK